MNSSPLPPVIEITENSDKTSESENENIDSNEFYKSQDEVEIEIMPEIKFSLDSFSEEKANNSAVRIMELEQALQTENWRFQQEIFNMNQEYHSTISHMSMELDIYQTKTKIYRKQIEEMKKELEITKKNLIEEQQIRKTLEEKILAITVNSEEKESSLLALLEQRDQDNFQQRTENEKLQKRIEELNDELSNRKLMKQESHSTIGMSITDSMDADFLKTNESDSSKEISKKFADPIDIALKEQLAKLNLHGHFRKQQSNVYCYGNKKVYIILKNGKLLCRCGIGFQAFDDFIKNANFKANSSPPKVVHRRSNTASGDLHKIHPEFEPGNGYSPDSSKMHLKNRVGTPLLGSSNSSKSLRK
ncbi:unnamed protein product [Blepharisma stoltei]|uniref:Uncharacterized protein n=1 Tax=Blepharisma stoltei TaxID=1481888 RepID=A0AAU9K249_9CILI|nr:unnamed protein product [Blepharisma stoltei]